MAARVLNHLIFGIFTADRIARGSKQSREFLSPRVDITGAVYPGYPTRPRRGRQYLTVVFRAAAEGRRGSFRLAGSAGAPIKELGYEQYLSASKIPRRDHIRIAGRGFAAQKMLPILCGWPAPGH